MIGNRDELASFQSIFYRNKYHKVLRSLIVSCVIIFILIVTIIYFILNKSPTYFYATSLSGQVIPMVSAAQRINHGP